MIFEFRIQLFLGNQPFSKPYTITWKNGTQDLNPEFNKRIYFDVNYSQIPNFCSVLFKLKFMQYNEDNEVFGNQTKYYGNFRLFDHNLRLKCGTHKINLYTGLFKDDAYLPIIISWIMMKKISVVKYILKLSILIRQYIIKSHVLKIILLKAVL